MIIKKSIVSVAGHHFCTVKLSLILLTSSNLPDCELLVPELCKPLFNTNQKFTVDEKDQRKKSEKFRNIFFALTFNQPLAQSFSFGILHRKKLIKSETFSPKET